MLISFNSDTSKDIDLLQEEFSHWILWSLQFMVEVLKTNSDDLYYSNQQGTKGKGTKMVPVKQKSDLST